MTPLTSQQHLALMALQSVKSTDLSAVKSLKSGVILAEIWVSAGLSLGMQKKEMAALLDLSAPDFTAAFDVQNPKNAERNRLMKVPISLEHARKIALLLCEATGLAVGGPDVERNALADVLSSCAAYVRVMSRG